MADDVEILKQIERQFGIELKPRPLEKIIGKNNGFAVDHTGQVKGLNLYGREIRDISFLRSSGGLTLTHLSLPNNQITDITPLSALTKLEILQLRDNLITNLTSLSALTNLTKLDLDGNQIMDLRPLRELKRLKILDVRNNFIERFPPEITSWWPLLEIKWDDRYLIVIEGLNLYGNPLTDPPAEIVKWGNDAVQNYFDEIKWGRQEWH
jgi:internalin A